MGNTDVHIFLHWLLVRVSKSLGISASAKAWVMGMLQFTHFLNFSLMMANTVSTEDNAQDEGGRHSVLAPLDLHFSCIACILLLGNPSWTMVKSLM